MIYEGAIVDLICLIEFKPWPFKVIQAAVGLLSIYKFLLPLNLEFKPCSTIKVISNIETFFSLYVYFSKKVVLTEIMLYIHEVVGTYS